MMRYEEQPPSSALAPYIESFWMFEIESGGAARAHVIVPDGTLSISVTDLGGETHLKLTGPHTRARRIEALPGAIYRGARLRAGAVKAALGVDPGLWVDAVAPLAQARPDISAILASGYDRGTGLSGFKAQVEASLRPDPALLDAPVAALVAAIAAVEGETPLTALMRRGTLGPRQLRRRFIAATGLTPKTYARLRRVRRACIGLAELPPGELAALSADAGYADQPHFSREMREVFGMSAQMLHAYLRQIAHHNVR